MWGTTKGNISETIDTKGKVVVVKDGHTNDNQLVEEDFDEIDEGLKSKELIEVSSNERFEQGKMSNDEQHYNNTDDEEGMNYNIM